MGTSLMSNQIKQLRKLIKSSDFVNKKSSKENVLKMFEKCSEEQSELINIICQQLVQIKSANSPLQCVRYTSGTKHAYIPGEEAFSLQSELIRFDLGKHEEDLVARIRLAKKTLPVVN
jgi:hypothetical protein